MFFFSAHSIFTEATSGKGLAGFTGLKKVKAFKLIPLKPFTVAGFIVCKLKCRRDKDFGEYTIVYQLHNNENILLHNQFTTCMTLRNATNLFPHLSKAFFRRSAANESIYLL
jgi:hypothetical protein